MVLVRRVYDEPEEGYRVLVDRLWPRGVKRDSLPLDEWLKDLAPSDELRRWYGHDVGKWTEFRHRYRQELLSEDRQQLLDHLRRKAREGRLVLLTATRDVEHSNAEVLRELLEEGEGR